MPIGAKKQADMMKTLYWMSTYIILRMKISGRKLSTYIIEEKMVETPK